MYFGNPAFYVEELQRELESLTERGEKQGMDVAVRLNAFSDWPWEVKHREIFDANPNIQFYDYTKALERARRYGQWLNGTVGMKRWPSNYHLTYSWNEKSVPGATKKLLNAGVNVARVGEPTKDWWSSYEWADGDEHDLTFTHRPGSVLILKPKGDALSSAGIRNNKFLET